MAQISIALFIALCSSIVLALSLLTMTSIWGTSLVTKARNFKSEISSMRWTPSWIWLLLTLNTWILRVNTNCSNVTACHCMEYNYWIWIVNIQSTCLCPGGKLFVACSTCRTPRTVHCYPIFATIFLSKVSYIVELSTLSMVFVTRKINLWTYVINYVSLEANLQQVITSPISPLFWMFQERKSAPPSSPTPMLTMKKSPAEHNLFLICCMS